MTISRFGRAAHARNFGSFIFRSAYSTEVHGAHHVPLHGPLIVLVDSIDPVGQLLIKSLAPRPLSAFTQVVNTEVVGDILWQAPYGISAQLTALDALSQGGALLVNTGLVDPGFLVARDPHVGVVPASLWVSNRDGGTFTPWGTRPASPRARVRLYFDKVITPIVGEASAAVDSGIVTIDRFVSEQCRQILHDHHDVVTQRLGERAAR